MAANYIRSKDRNIAAEYATKSALSYYWHSSLNGFLAGVRYTRKIKLGVIPKGRTIFLRDTDKALGYATKAPFIRGMTTYWSNSYDGFLNGVRYACRKEYEKNLGLSAKCKAACL